MSKLYPPLGSEFSCPDMEMIPLKTTENRKSSARGCAAQTNHSNPTLPQTSWVCMRYG